MELDEALERVKDRQSFLRFVACLAADRADEIAKEKVSPSSPYGPGAKAVAVSAPMPSCCPSRWHTGLARYRRSILRS